MRLITSLTTLTAAALLASALTACAGGSPRRPASTEEKSDISRFEQDCYEARRRGVADPAGCPQTTTRNNRRTAPPSLDRDSLPLPNLPATALPGGGVLGR